jgi:hypothetical protein
MRLGVLSAFREQANALLVFVFELEEELLGNSASRALSSMIFP